MTDSTSKEFNGDIETVGVSINSNAMTFRGCFCLISMGAKHTNDFLLLLLRVLYLEDIDDM